MRLSTPFMMFCTVFLLSGCSRTLWIQDDFNAVKPPMDTVSVIFPQVRFAVRDGKTERPKTGFSLFVSGNVAEALQDLINEGAFVPRSARVLYDTVTINNWLRTYFADSTRTFRTMRDSLQLVEDGKRMLRMTPQLQASLADLRTRYFIFVSGAAFAVSENAMQFDMQQREIFKQFYDRPYVYDYQWYGLQLQISLVDARSGEILWYNYNDESDTKYDPSNKDDVRRLCMKLLQTDE